MQPAGKRAGVGLHLEEPGGPRQETLLGPIHPEHPAGESTGAGPGPLLVAGVAPGSSGHPQPSSALLESRTRENHGHNGLAFRTMKHPPTSPKAGFREWPPCPAPRVASSILGRLRRGEPASKPRRGSRRSSKQLKRAAPRFSDDGNPVGGGRPPRTQRAAAWPRD
jgi:hypothetical protein